MRWKKVFGNFAVCTALIISGCLYFDVKLAEFVKEIGVSPLLWGPVGSIPDMLFWLVCVTTAFAWTGRLYLSMKPVKSWNGNFFEHIGCSVPLAFVLKHLLKDLFGRTSTQFWLLHPEQLGFHWFHGGGDFSAFPSGHMTVFTALVLGVSRYFPRLRPVCLGLLFILALTLILTQYHFFSDLVAGIYLGVIADLLVWRALLLLHRSSNVPSKLPCHGARGGCDI